MALLALARAATGAEADVRPLDLSDLGAPAFTVYTTRDGVPDEVIVAAEVDAQGFAWLGSASTVARFDGQSWERLAPEGATSLVRTLHLDSSGTLWAAFDSDGVARFDGRRWRRETQADGLVTQKINKIAGLAEPGGGETLWALTADAGLLRRVGERWEPDPGNAELPQTGAWGLAQTRRLFGTPRTWVGMFNGGLWYREPGGHWRRYDVPALDHVQVTEVLTTEEHGEETLWVLTYGAGLIRVRADGLRAWNEQRGDLPSSLVYAGCASRAPNGEAVLWLASRAGLLRVHGERVDTYDRRHGLPSNAVRGVQIRRSPDGADVLWVATEAGIARTVVGSSPWRTVSLMGARANGAFSVLPEPDGRGGERLWIGASGDGVGLLEGGRWRLFNKENGGLPSSNARVVQRVLDDAGASALFVGVDGGELLRATGDLRFEQVPTPWPKHVGENVMHVLGREHEGARELWFAMRQGGIYRRRAGVWSDQRPPGAQGVLQVVRFAEQLDDRGRAWLWATTSQGLGRYDGSAWSLLGAADGLPDLDLRSISLLGTAERPELWVGSTRQGLIRLDVRDPEAPRVLPPGQLPPAPDRTVYGALRDSTGRIYLCTNNGVQRLSPRPQGGYESRVFTRRDGLVHEECNTNAQVLDRHDRYWVGTLAGVSVYDPAAQPAQRGTYTAPLRLTDVRVDGARVEAPRMDGDVRLVVPPGTREFRLGFALLTWQREDESRYRTNLLGYDPEPGAFGSENFRSFGELPPGEYTLEVEARDYAGVAGAPLALAIEVLPAWWQTTRVRVLAALAALLTIYVGVRLRLHALREQRRRLRAEVAARTLELDAANALLTELSYMDALTGVANRRRLMERLGAAWESARAKQRELALILVDIDHFKDYNDRHGHVAGDHALHAVAEAIRAAAGTVPLVARYGGEEFACVLEDADLDEAVAMAERIRAAVAASGMQVADASGETITLSAGVAAFRPADGEGFEALVRAADEALYRAKHEGRNRVCTAVR